MDLGVDTHKFHKTTRILPVPGKALSISSFDEGKTRTIPNPIPNTNLFIDETFLSWHYDRNDDDRKGPQPRILLLESWKLQGISEEGGHDSGSSSCFLLIYHKISSDLN